MDTVQDAWSRLSDAAVYVASSVSETITDTGSEIGSRFQTLTGDLGSAVSQHASIMGLSRPPAPSPPPPGFWNSIGHRIVRHKQISVAIGLGSTALGAWAGYTWWKTRSIQSNGRRRKRLARRAADGGRVEVVLIVGSPAEPLVRLIAADMNIRGFIVYLTTFSTEEEEWVHREKSSDIRIMRVSNPDSEESIRTALATLTQLLETPVASFSGGTSRYLSLAGVILLPEVWYPSGPLEATNVAAWNHILHTRIQVPINMLTAGLLDAVRQHASRLVLVTPTIIGSLAPPFHVAESVCTAALGALSLSLSRELNAQRISFTHMKLGSFDTHHVNTTPTPLTEQQVLKSMRADILGWPERVRRLYAAPYSASAYLQTNRTRGSKLRALHHALYDVLESQAPPRIVRVGRGGYAYEMLAAALPESVMSFILATSS